MEFSCLTRANTPPKGKRYVYLHAMKCDANLRNRIAEMILSFPEGRNYAVWTADDPESLSAQRNLENLQPMNLWVLLVTDAMLDWAAKDGRPLLDAVAAQGAGILPVFAEPGVIPRFNRIFGDLHGVLMTAEDAPAKLETQLAHFLISDALSGEIIRDAFTAGLFLSYRKKDKKEALRVMKAIHDSPRAESVAIWYDEFLNGGENFNREIQAALEASDAMVLTVTPNLLEKDNYVRRVEYPNAAVASKPVIPFRAAPTDPETLRTEFPDMPDCVPVEDAGRVAGALEPFTGAPDAKRRKPYLDYLLGMAFLTGLRVEKDMGRARKLLEAAAARNVPEAAAQLGFLFLAGISVQRDPDAAALWKRKAFDMEPTDLPGEPALNRVHELLYGVDGLVLLLKSRDRLQEALEVNERFWKALRTHGDLLDERRRALWETEACFAAADLHFDVCPGQDRIRQAEEACDRALSAFCGCKALTHAESCRLDAQYHALLSQIRKRKGDLPGAEASACEALKWQEWLVADTASPEDRETLATIQGMLGLLLRDRALMEAQALKPYRQTNQRAFEHLSAAVQVQQQSLEEKPTISNREGMAMAWYNLALMNGTGEKPKDLDLKGAQKRSLECLKKAETIAGELRRDFPDESFRPSEKEIAKLRRTIRASGIVSNLFFPALLVGIGVLIWILVRR